MPEINGRLGAFIDYSSMVLKLIGVPMLFAIAAWVIRVEVFIAQGPYRTEAQVENQTSGHPPLEYRRRIDERFLAQDATLAELKTRMASVEGRLALVQTDTRAILLILGDKGR